MAKKTNVRRVRKPRVLHRPPDAFWGLREEECLWHETPEEVARMLALGARKAMLLQWVRRQMSRKLTPWERYCLRQHYFRDQSVSAIARASRKSPSAVRRTLQRGIRKLRAVACDDPAWRV